MEARDDMDMAAKSAVRAQRNTSRERATTRGGRLCATERNESRRQSSRLGLTPLELALIVVLVIAVVIAAVASRPSQASTSVRTTSVKVANGETLWSIAAANAAEGLTTQQTVELIRRSNHLSGNTIAVGSVLRVPAVSSPAVALAR